MSTLFLCRKQAQDKEHKRKQLRAQVFTDSENKWWLINLFSVSGLYVYSYVATRRLKLQPTYY
jgi:hypothetical protein